MVALMLFIGLLIGLLCLPGFASTIKALIVLAALIGSVVLFYKYKDNVRVRPITAAEVSDAIRTHKPHGRDPKGICYDALFGPADQKVLFLCSERRLTDEALRLIASNDINFFPYYQLRDTDTEILSSKTRGWIALCQDDGTAIQRHGREHYNNLHFNNLQLLANSAANIWIVRRPEYTASKSDLDDPKWSLRDFLGKWGGHTGGLRIDMNTHGQKEEYQKWIEREGLNKEVEFCVFQFQDFRE